MCGVCVGQSPAVLGTVLGVVALGCESPVPPSSRKVAMGLVVSTMWDNNWFWMLCGSSSGFKVGKEMGIFFYPRAKPGVTVQRRQQKWFMSAPG